MGQDHDPNLSGSDKLILAVSMTLLFALALLLVGGAFLFGFAGLFQLFSVQYDTKSSLIYYIVFLIPLTLLFEIATMSVLIRVLPRLTKKWIMMVLKMGVSFLFIWIPLYLTDEWIKGITVPLYTELVAALLLLVLDSLVEKRHF
ncbi:regulatory YrvL family protein [Sutcliffiella horikoshii]|uniref:YrvL family regulatory protein n=1 Tax=Sutcliffiella horikoshii TaxID=79883 RepID=UPI0038506F4D